MLYDDDFLARLEAGLRGALPRWGLAPDAPLRRLAVSENATFLVESPDGTPVVFRIHRPGYHTCAEIRSELSWLAAVRGDAVVRAAAPLPSLDGDLIGGFDDDGTRRHVVAFSFVAGREPEPGMDLPHWYRVLGGVTARLHRHARGWRPPQGFRRKTWDIDAILGADALWGDWRAGPGLDGAGRAVLERAALRLRDDIRDYGVSRDTFGLVHCDLRPANLLVEGDRLAVIDFDDCGFGWFMYDFAASVSFMEHEPFVADLEAAWLDGYAAVAPLAAADVAMLPAFCMLRRMQLTAWIASHAETPTARALGAPFTQGTVALAERYLVRAATCSARGPGPLPTSACPA